MLYVTPKVKISERQAEALDILSDTTTKQLLYGGGAGGGKTRLMCLWGTIMSLRYIGIRGVVGRESLKDLRETTLLSFFDTFTEMGMVAGTDYVYNKNDSTITFPQTKSSILFLNMGYYPADPNYDRFGSREYTWGAIDEAPMVRQRAKNIILSRIRYKLKENGLTPKLLLTCNPTKGYLYTEFYKPNKDGVIAKDRKFMRALLSDNPFIDPSYRDTLLTLDQESIERLLYGNWEYDDDPAALVKYDALADLFSNVVDVPVDANGSVSPNNKYIVADIARFGNDRTVLSYWEGLKLRRIAVFTKLPIVPDMRNPSATSSASKIEDWRKLYGVPLSHVLVDEGGVGGGALDNLHCKGFDGARKPTPMPSMHKIAQNYFNLRAQCYYELAKCINARNICLDITDDRLRDQIIHELEQIRAKNHDRDGKLQIVPKEEIKERIGRSPDLADTIMMRMWFELLPKPSVSTYDPFLMPR